MTKSTYIPTWDAPAAIRKRNAAEEMFDALEAVEWVFLFDTADGWGGYVACPCCENPESKGHLPGCKLDAALKKARGE